jgi:hypothetical protein
LFSSLNIHIIFGIEENEKKKKEVFSALKIKSTNADTMNEKAYVLVLKTNI